MNVDTDTQYAFTRPVADWMFRHYDGVLKVDGEDGPGKARRRMSRRDVDHRSRLPGEEVGGGVDGQQRRGDAQQVRAHGIPSGGRGLPEEAGRSALVGAGGHL